LSRLIVTKAEFQEMAEQRLAEAKALLDQGKWNGAYYLAAYAVELALKACIIKTLLATDAFPDKDFSKNCYARRREARRAGQTGRRTENRHGCGPRPADQLGASAGLVGGEAVSQHRQGRGGGALHSHCRWRTRSAPMDQDTMVSEQTERGKRLIEALAADGFDIRVAFWACSP